MTSFLKNLISYKLQAKSYKLNRGMTYIELIVVLSIFAIMSSIVIFNYGEFQARVDVKNLASDIALKIVEAQKSAMSGKASTQATVLPWKPSYGVYFNSSLTVDTFSTPNIPYNQRFIYFVDADNYVDYSGTPNCISPGANECIDRIIITKGNFISKVEAIGSSCPVINDLGIIFTRPDSRANLIYNNLPIPCSINYAQITIQSPKMATATIRIYPSGRVQVN